MILDGNRAIDCIQAETIAIRKRKFLNRFSVVNNLLCQVSESHQGALQKRINRSRCRLAAAVWREPNEVFEMKHTSGWGSDSPTERSTLRKMYPRPPWTVDAYTLHDRRTQRAAEVPVCHIIGVSCHGDASCRCHYCSNLLEMTRSFKSDIGHFCQ